MATARVTTRAQILHDQQATKYLHKLITQKTIAIYTLRYVTILGFRVAFKEKQKIILLTGFLQKQKASILDLRSLKFSLI